MYYFQDSLGGNAKTVMICCISPSSSDFDESLNALKYAQRARKIKNKPVVNVDVHAAQLEELRCEVRSLRQQLNDNTHALPGSQMSREISDVTSKQSSNNTDSLPEQHLLLTRCLNEAREILFSVHASPVSSSVKFCIQQWLNLINQLQLFETTDDVTCKQACTDVLSDGDCVRNAANLEHHSYSAREQTSHTQRLLQLQQAIKVLERECEKLLTSLEKVNMEKEGQTEQFLSQFLCIQNLINSILVHGDLKAEEESTVGSTCLTVNSVMSSFYARNKLLMSQLEEADMVVTSACDNSQDGVDDSRTRSSLSSTRTLPNPTVLNIDDMRTSQVAGEMSERIGMVESVAGPVDDDQGSVCRSGEVRSLRGSGKVCCEDATTTPVPNQLRLSMLSEKQLQQKFRDLTINIRMKEQLIGELDRQANDTEAINEQYEARITALEGEAERTRVEVARSSATRGEGEGPSEAVERYRRLRERVQEMKNLSFLAKHHRSRLAGLQNTVSSMKEQREELKELLHQHRQGQLSLESDVLSTRSQTFEQEEGIRIRSTDEILCASTLGMDDGDLTRAVERTWLDVEAEKILAQRQMLNHLNEELKRREEIIAKREALLEEKAALELKKMRQSRILHEQSSTTRLTRADEDQSDTRWQHRCSSAPALAEGRHASRAELFRAQKDGEQEEQAMHEDWSAGLSAFEERR
ncbi:PREDICTED: kinesin-like protein KIF27 [Priapulus caudatus]|uniref:Kinesin-like protein KIF27 n=1 Tax=Priapulus caudatus TaxID=37621 RepID=A0ABM1E0J1_PRICU|nr:PREDICTED: kinesin-like protein KIF27 [Priapulus caudatus]